MDDLFGTDGIRGRANEPPLVPGVLTSIGEAAGSFWKDRSSSNKVILGHDGRISHDLLENSLMAGLISIGLCPQKIGLCTTPALSYLSREKHVAGGIMISASHNTYDDNGIKFFQGTGEKFLEHHENEVSSRLSEESDRVRGKHLGQVFPRESWISNYIQGITRKSGDFPGHLVVDCAHGGASQIAAPILEPAVQELTVLNDEPDGTNINKNSGSLHPENLAETVVEKEADLGFALDGDGDRVIAVDENGEIVNGDTILYLLAKYFDNQEMLPGPGLVMTSMSNLGLRLILEKNEIDFEVVGVGDRVVYSKMNELDWRLGGEQSGHIIDRNWLPTGDGLNTILHILNAMITETKTLSQWDEEIETFPQVLHNIDVNKKPSIQKLQRTCECIESIEEKLGDEGRVLVRYSGTEPVARIMLEGRNEDVLSRHAGKIGDVMKDEIEEVT